MRRYLAVFLSLLLVLAPLTAFADSLSISAWQTGDSLNSTNLNSRMNSISTWANGLVANDNIKSSAAIAGSKLDLTSGTGRITHTTSVTSDAPVLTSAQTWNSAGTLFTGWRLNVTNTNSASASRLVDLQVGGTSIASISRTGQFNLAAQNIASGSTGTTRGAWFNIASATYTDNLTPASGTAQAFVAYAFQQPVLSASNSSVTTASASTVFIAGPPIQGPNQTITKAMALNVEGAAKIAGPLEIASYSQAGLPTASTAGRLARVTDGIRGVWIDTGTTWRSVTGWADVMDFGAVGDGVANDAAALNACFALTDKTCFLPAGTYLVSSNLSDPTVARIIGAGMFATTIQAATGVTKALAFGAATNNHLTNLKDFNVKGNATTNARGIVFGDGALTSDLLVENVWVYNFTGTGAIAAYFRDIVSSVFVNFQTGSSTVGMQFEYSAVANTPDNLVFYGGDTSGATTKGIKILTGRQIKFKDYTVESNTQEGVFIQPTSGNVISDIVFEDGWFEENYGSTTTESQFVCAGTGLASTSIQGCRIIRGNFVGGVGKAQAIGITGQATYQIYKPRIATAGYPKIVIGTSPAPAGEVEIDVDLAILLTMVSGGSLFYDMQDAGGAWTAYTPTYSSDIGNQAATFSGSVTTSVARYKRMGKTLFVNLSWSGTLIAVTPAYIVLTLPTNFVAKSTALYTPASLKNDATWETGVFETRGTNLVRFNRANFVVFGSSVAVAGSVSAVIELDTFQ